MHKEGWVYTFAGMLNDEQKWYRNWFNSPYYHILYNKRDEREAEFLIDNLCAYLRPAEHARMLDVGCGKGRHSIYLNKKGYDVVGIDLSQENIKEASKYTTSHLRFFVQDMRETVDPNQFNFVFNLFTSFGFFEDDADHQKAVSAFADALKPGGILVLDFMNALLLKDKLVQKEEKNIEGISFRIKRGIEKGTIVKRIEFEDRGHAYSFTEEVKALLREDFERYFDKAGLVIENVFGNYHLDPFEAHSSDRLLFICRKESHA